MFPINYIGALVNVVRKHDSVSPGLGMYAIMIWHID